MTTRDALVRESDDKWFRPTWIAHWSEIVADDGDFDSVKWFGDNTYVSAHKGFTYRVVENGVYADKWSKS